MVHRRENGYRRGKVLQTEHGEKRPKRGQDQHGSTKFMRPFEVPFGSFGLDTL